MTLPPLGIGTAALAVSYGVAGAHREAPPPAAAVATLELALEHGLRFVDTAPAYGDAERLVGATCEGVECVIATKVAVPTRPWRELTSAEIESHVRASTRRSLEALRRDRIDLLQIHNADAELIADGRVPAQLDALRSDGLVQACGATVYGPQNALAALRCGAFDAVQVAYSALDRRVEAIAHELDRATCPLLIGRSVLLRGVLSGAGRSLAGALAPLGRAADRFRAAAGVSWEELPGAALAWAMARGTTACTLLGPRDSRELEALLDGARRQESVARGLDGDWDAELDSELLDPSRWPEEP